MKVWKFLKKHKWPVRIVVLALIVSSFALAQIWLHAYQTQLDFQVAQADSSASIAASKAIVADNEREAAAKLEADKKAADEQVAKQQASTSTSTPSGYSTAPHRDPRRIDVVVNKKNPLVPADYVPSVVAVSCAGNGAITVEVQVKDDLVALCNAANAAGVPITASTAYRSYSFQSTLYNQYVAESGQVQADTFSARPGYSEHQTGFAIDFRVPNGAKLSDFTGTAQQQWLVAHGAEYGFIQRYTDANSAETGYEAESWHYRYIGRGNTAAYLASGKLSLESFWGIAGGGY